MMTLTPKTIEHIFCILSAQNPTPKTELVYANHFQLLVAVVLSAQATDKSVNQATPALFKAAPTPEALFALGEAGLIPYIQRIGLYRSKAKHLIAAAKTLVEQHNSQVPHTREALMQLPGVGRKTANVILNEAFGEPTIAVDTHVFRVAKRLGFSQSNNVLQVERDLLTQIPAAYLASAHHWLILHGRYRCKALRPLCASCPLQSLCVFYAESETSTTMSKK